MPECAMAEGRIAEGRLKGSGTQAVEVACQEDHVDLWLPLPALDAPPQLRELVAVGGQGGAPVVVEKGACASSDRMLTADPEPS